MKSSCYIELFGGLRLDRADRQIVRFRTYKTAALLAYLAFYQDKPHSREVLSALFWPNGEDSRLSLRVALGSLRRQLEPPGAPNSSVLIAARACVHLNSAAVRTDVGEFEAALKTAAASAPSERVQRLLCAIDLYRGELLPGYYEDWIGPERERLADAYRGALHQFCSLLEAASDVNTALEYAHRAVIAERFQEEGYVTLMRLYRKAGRFADALRQYEHLKQVLKDELGASPTPTTRRLAEEIGLEGGQPLSELRTTPRQRETPTARPHTADPPALTARPRLPLNFNRFFGRELETARLKQLLLSSRGAVQS